MATEEELYSLHTRQNEVWRRIKSGSLSIENALEGTQGILDGKYPIKEPPSTWHVSPEEQLIRMWNLNEARGWGFAQSDFVERRDLLGATLREGEQLLLCAYPPNEHNEYSVSDTLDEFWGLVQLPLRWSRVLDRSLYQRVNRHVRSYYPTEPRPRICWKAYNPHFARNMSVAMAQQEADNAGVRLAGVEVLMALVMREGWKGQPETITMSGLRFMNLGTVPVVQWTSHGRVLRLGQTNEYTTGLDYHPSIRDLET